MLPEWKMVMWYTDLPARKDSSRKEGVGTGLSYKGFIPESSQRYKEENKG